VTETDIQSASLDIWDKKYRYKDTDSNPIDQTIDDTYKRVAKGLATVEKEDTRAQHEKEFLWAIRNGAIPAGRITSNVGADEFKPKVSLINCTVSGTVNDSMRGILDSVHESGLTLSAGCGIGYEFSTLRPSGAYVDGVGATTSGPLSFMNIHDAMCFTVASAGGRRGAQMGTFDISHPDIVSFILAKRQDGTLRQFNLSVLITDDFMDAVKNDDEWPLVFPVHHRKYDDNDSNAYIWKAIHHDSDTHVVNNDGEVAHEIYSIIPAKDLYDIMMKSTYDFAEPGFILIDQVNTMNNLNFCENIRATNPCGEQPLPPHGACLLGSVNLTKFVKKPFMSNAEFDFDKFTKVVGVFTRMLDNVVEMNGLPLPQQQKEITDKRRHGMGYTGLGSVMTMLGMEYGSKDSLEFTDKVTMMLAIEGWRVSAELAKEKGMAPIFKKRWNGKKGLTLFLDTPYMQRIKSVAPDIWDALKTNGSRFSHHTSIAPTGTISLALCNNVSNGIEPSFSHSYFRNVIREGKKTKDQMEVVSAELFEYRKLFGQDSSAPEEWKSADNIDPLEHVKVQAAAQKWIDSSISKTINVPQDYPFDRFKDIYMYAYDNGLKGCTTFRFNPEAFSGVLVNEADLQSTKYKFKLEDGTEHIVSGNDTIEYDGESHKAANLYDAIKEGYYGKF